MRFRPTTGRAAILSLACLAVGTVDARAQNPTPWSLSPQPASGRQVIPFFEGWFANPDGTYTLSFGYLNRNPEEVVEIPLGERNYIEPSQFDGAQPTMFYGSRLRGAFAVTIPAEMRDEDVWWHITSQEGQTYSVPGRTMAAAYELDWAPRAHGSVAPHVWLESENEAVQGPEGLWADEPIRARVGLPVPLTVHVRDDSERDRDDPRFRETVPVRVVWRKHQGPPGEIEFSREESVPRGPARYGAPATAGLSGVPQARGAAMVTATFPAPGEYVVLAMADNWTSPDSSAGDQCCWTNAYIRVSVTP